MKFKSLFAAPLLLSSVAFAGVETPLPVDVDLAGQFALGNMRTARESKNDVEFIGCGTRGAGTPVQFGFCQATDAANEFIFCLTDNPDFIAAVRGLADYSTILFSWVVNEGGDATCTRLGTSTQSFYLPKK